MEEKCKQIHPAGTHPGLSLKSDVFLQRTGFRDKFNLNPGSKIIGTLLYDMIAIFILWPIVVVNTELLIQWNGFKKAEGSQWQFGQVSSFPLITDLKVFNETFNCPFRSLLYFLWSSR